jgi:checkpoint serine/threonine-protein kinase
MWMRFVFAILVMGVAHCSQDDNAKTPHRSREENLGTLSAKKPTADTLKRDPLRNFHQADSPSNDKSKAESKVTTQPIKPSSKSKTSKSIPSTKPNEKLQINTSLLILADGTEIHPLELRARDFGVADKKWPPPSLEETMDQSSAMNGSINRNGLSGHALGDHEEQVDFEGTKPMTLGSTFAAMTREATVTINTKAALMDVYGMYNSPTKSMTTGRQMAAMRDPQELSAPTPSASAVKVNTNDENAGTARKLSEWRQFTSSPGL